MFTAAVILAHAAGRPIPPSSLRSQSVPSMDEDDSTQEEEIVFSVQTDKINMFDRFFRGTHGSLIKPAENEEIFHANPRRSCHNKKVD
jgi:hypothetical protein